MIRKSEHRIDPVTVAWQIIARPEDIAQLRRRFGTIADLDRHLQRVQVAMPAHELERREEHSRLRDFFDDIVLADDETADAKNLLLSFHRCLDSPPNWKDVMALIMRELRDVGTSIDFILDHREPERKPV